MTLPPDKRWVSVLLARFASDADIGALAGRVDPGPGGPEGGHANEPQPADIKSIEQIRSF